MFSKKIIAASIGLFMLGSAHAAVSTFDVLANIADTPYKTVGFDRIDGIYGELNFAFGALGTSQAGTVTYTYLGKEAGNTNVFGGWTKDPLSISGVFYTDSTSVGSSFSQTVETGTSVLNFAFGTTAPANQWVVAPNGSSYSPTTEVAFGIANGLTVNNVRYDKLLLWNDVGGGARNNHQGDKDFDDMVIGVRFTAAPVPEPETYAMFLAGLGLIGAIARRRKLNA